MAETKTQAVVVSPWARVRVRNETRHVVLQVLDFLVGSYAHSYWAKPLRVGPVSISHPAH